MWLKGIPSAIWAIVVTKKELPKYSEKPEPSVEVKFSL